jgi:hypothetical protein
MFAENRIYPNSIPNLSIAELIRRSAFNSEDPIFERWAAVNSNQLSIALVKDENSTTGSTLATEAVRFVHWMRNQDAHSRRSVRLPAFVKAKSQPERKMFSLTLEAAEQIGAGAAALMNRWFDRLSTDVMKFLRVFVRRVRKHMPDVCAFWLRHSTNGYTEAMNDTLEDIARTRGHISFDHARDKTSTCFCIRRERQEHPISVQYLQPISTALAWGTRRASSASSYGGGAPRAAKVSS